MSNPEIACITTQKRNLDEYASVTGGVVHG